MSFAHRATLTARNLLTSRSAYTPNTREAGMRSNPVTKPISDCLKGEGTSCVAARIAMTATTHGVSRMMDDR